MPGATRESQGKILPLSLWKEHGPANAFISDLSSETATEQIYVVLNYQLCSNLSWQPYETNHDLVFLIFQSTDNFESVSIRCHKEEMSIWIAEWKHFFKALRHKEKVLVKLRNIPKICTTLYCLIEALSI